MANLPPAMGAVTVTEQQRFLAYLHAAALGRENAVTAKVVKLATGISTRRQQELIIELQAQGVVVCSACEKPHGYYLPEGATDVAPFLHQLRERRNALAKRIVGIERQYPALREVRERGRRIEPTGAPRQEQLELAV